MTGVEINDEVSKRVLSYVAPVLNQATHVNGKVALDVKQAEFPITGPANRRSNMTGKLEFENVVFAPGPFATELLTMTGQKGSPGVQLKQPLELSIADGRVMQKGLKIPVGNDAELAMEGSVGFDQTLDMKATVPVSANIMGVKTGLDKSLGLTTVVVPIGGTVTHPTLNKQALNGAVKQITDKLLKKELSSNASGLMDKIVPSGGSGSIEKDIEGLGNQLLNGIGSKRRKP